jgi:hypothetical protein
MEHAAAVASMKRDSLARGFHFGRLDLRPGTWDP